ncbi:MAG TPA: hypothetical protein PLQ97_08665 [Myxococcota bacterium]|nr:hypothetical protein [Myxococcota bacterium]HQK51381.1 hypothetical protein [Myxococcota bacterium]
MTGMDVVFALSMAAVLTLALRDLLGAFGEVLPEDQDRRGGALPPSDDQGGA